MKSPLTLKFYVILMPTCDWIFPSYTFVHKSKLTSVAIRKISQLREFKECKGEIFIINTPHPACPAGKWEKCLCSVEAPPLYWRSASLSWPPQEHHSAILPGLFNTFIPLSIKYKYYFLLEKPSSSVTPWLRSAPASFLSILCTKTRKSSLSPLSLTPLIIFHPHHTREPSLVKDLQPHQSPKSQLMVSIQLTSQCILTWLSTHIFPIFSLLSHCFLFASEAPHSLFSYFNSLFLLLNPVANHGSPGLGLQPSLLPVLLFPPVPTPTIDLF